MTKRINLQSLGTITALFFLVMPEQLVAAERQPVVRAVEPSDEVFHFSDWEDVELPAVQPATMLQPTPLVTPRTVLGGEGNANAPDATAAMPAAARGATGSFTGRTGLVSSFAVRDQVLGSEGAARATTDVGSLLQKSSGALSVGVQARTPVVNDPRIRSSRIGALSASGSHWVPARIDLDTVLSKFDSRQIESTSIVPGPYASRYGPGFSFTDIELLKSPRYKSGYELHGGTDVDYKSNGAHWFGQQSFAAGDRDWGTRFNYGHRTGEDYISGSGQQIPSSFNSREFTLASGRDFRDGHSVELSVLRLDQTGMEFPGYVFDMDYLVTDGYEGTHVKDGGLFFDQCETTAWYNRTRFRGNAQNPAKRPFFPLFALINYTAVTDVDSMSTGYRQAYSWGTERDAYRLSLGHDLRFVKQELSEVSNGFSLGLPIPFANRNSPIPRSYSVNPGVFIEYEEEFLDDWTYRSGARFDYVETDIVEDAANLAQVGLQTIPASYAEIVGTNRYNRDFQNFSVFSSLDYKVNRELTQTLSVGYAERPPNLTELYAAQPFMLLLQNGLNNVTGDPRLKDEKLVQVDLAWDYKSKPLRAGLRLYHAWAFDYITFENTRVQFVPPVGEVGQVSLRYVNTEFATFTGFESFAELYPEDALTPFVTMKFVDGRDRTRNGDFATLDGSNGNPSRKVIGAIRGAASNIVGADSEPLPGVSPFESRAGLRWKDTSRAKRWSVELSARMVDQQDRIATSLLETPTPGFTVWDMRTVLRPAFANALTLTMGIENFTDKNYREHLDFRTANGLAVFQPGITFYTGASLNW